MKTTQQINQIGTKSAKGVRSQLLSGSRAPAADLSIRGQLRQWYKNIPNLYHGSFRQKWIKALQRRSMKAAVTAKCQDCMNWDNSQIRDCNIVTCPLWQYRPFRDRNGKNEAEVIASVTEIDKNDN